jgi:hypothetical protein
MTGAHATIALRKHKEIRSGFITACGKVAEVTAPFQYTSAGFPRD